MNGTATAPAKIILFGEHAVVYGQPALAVPVPALRVSATISAATPSTGLTLQAVDLGQQWRVSTESAAATHPLERIALLTLQAIGQSPPDALLTVHSEIPIASGLGSGAAISAAIARALYLWFGLPPDLDQINGMVYLVEQDYHGTPSGIDNTVIVYEQPVYFRRGQPIERLRPARNVLLIIADTGVPASTMVSVGHVRQLITSDRARWMPVVEQIGAISMRARTALENGVLDEIGPLMNENHALLRPIGVSSADLDRLVDAARAPGAPGAKLSGGGMGGNMIALVTEDSRASVEQALRAAGAARVLHTCVEGRS